MASALDITMSLFCSSASLACCAFLLLLLLPLLPFRIKLTRNKRRNGPHSGSLGGKFLKNFLEFAKDLEKDGKQNDKSESGSKGRHRSDLVLIRFHAVHFGGCHNV
jgi:hypothetical protein